jgi:hypothetical protein
LEIAYKTVGQHHGDNTDVFSRKRILIMPWDLHLYSGHTRGRRRREGEGPVVMSTNECGKHKMWMLGLGVQVQTGQPGKRKT